LGVKYVYIGRHDVVFGVIGHLGALEQMPPVDLHGREFIGPGCQLRTALSPETPVDHLPRILVRFSENDPSTLGSPTITASVGAGRRAIGAWRNVGGVTNETRV